MTREEFECLSLTARPRMLAAARRFNSATGRCYDCEDIVQEALLTLWKLSESGYRITKPEGLVMTLTRNICVKYYRKYGKDSDHLREDVTSDGADYELEDLISKRDLLMRPLSETQKKYLKMKVDEEKTLDEIAEETGRPKTSIKTTISLARKLMLDALKKL